MVTHVASLLAFSALAQETPKPNTDRPDYTRDRINSKADRLDSTRESLAHPRANRLNGAAKASDVIGMTVKNYQNEKLGKVEDLGIDVASGRIVQVILSTGGFAGIGDRLTAVPPGALHHDVAQKVLHLEADKEKLKSAPKFEMSKWAECCDADHLFTVYRHYGQEAAFTFVQGRDAVRDGLRNLNDQFNKDQRNPNDRLNKDGQPNPNDQFNKDGQRNPNDQFNKDGQRSTTGSPNTPSTRRADGTWDEGRFSRDLIPVSRLSQIQKASKLIGTSVKNQQDEKLGKVENLLVDLAAGRVMAVIVSSGGFLGLGDELSAVPPAAFRFTADRDTLQLDASKEMLSSAPHFKANQWPDFNQPGYAEGVYRAYKVEPYFSTNATTEADNTRRNVRDRDDRTLTPLDQGTSQADRTTTAQIRKEVTAAKNLSVNARNVKIITNNGRVTLRGPVNSAEEKRLIAEIADRIARSGNVDNQLEVKLTTNNP